MTRWLAGIFDPRGHADSARVASALAPHASTVLAQGPLQIAHSGPASGARAPLCLLDGFLDNASELSAALELPDDASAEALLAAGWRRWGRGLPPRMRGDFALLIWDHEHGEGLLARDQLGVRSMFLHDNAAGLCFACEVRHLIALLPQRPAPDQVSVAHWLTMGQRPGSATLYAGIRRLNPGAMLLLDRGGMREEPYWTPRFSEPLDASEPQLATRMRAGLDRAVGRRIAADGMTGVMMSGGLDSASVAAVAATQAPGRVSAYSAVFPEHPAVDESALIEELRGTLGLGGVTAEVRAGGLLASALESIEAWQLPLLSWGDFWALPLLRAAVAEGVRVTLGGDGGDELFGARAHLLADRLRAGHPLQSVALARELPGAGDRPARRDVARILAEFAVAGALPHRLHELARRAFARRDAPGWLRPRAVRDLLDSADPLAWKRMDGPRWWAEVAHGLTRGVEEIGVFEHQRRRAASVGLEARHPLFDLDLVELGLRLPPRATFDRHLSRPVLRAAMGGLLPDAVRLRPRKALFDSVLVDSLDGHDGVLARRLLTDPAAELRAYIDPRDVERALFDDASQRRERPFQWMWQVWRLTTAELWLRAQADRGGEMLGAGLQTSRASVALTSAASLATDHASYVFPS
ncbi:MAG TPA: asparagine synthase-related protein [Solirubrobacteraceae bacterium]|nr:asparagine synthase-related protein [Solirubrobacteraceae bacterium]